MEQELATAGDCIEAASGEDGVDVTLIRWMLSLSPLQRLDVLQTHVNSVLRLRESVRLRS